MQAATHDGKGGLIVDAVSTEMYMPGTDALPCYLDLRIEWRDDRVIAAPLFGSSSAVGPTSSS